MVSFWSLCKLLLGHNGDEQRHRCPWLLFDSLWGPNNWRWSFFCLRVLLLNAKHSCSCQRVVKFLFWKSYKHHTKVYLLFPIYSGGHKNGNEQIFWSLHLIELYAWWKYLLYRFLPFASKIASIWLSSSRYLEWLINNIIWFVE